MHKLVRNAFFAAAFAGSMVMLTQTALAETTDQGGNGEGKLAIFLSASATSQASALEWGQTYYIELQNPGKKAKLWNEYNAPASKNFYFFSPPRTFRGDPGHWDLTNPTFHVTGTEIDGQDNQGGPFIYKVTLPSATTAQNQGYPNQDYSIEVSHVKMKHWTKKDRKWVLSNTGEDEMYFATDPQIGNVTITPPGTSGNMPEVPYAGVIPILVLAGGALLYLRRRRKSHA